MGNAHYWFLKNEIEELKMLINNRNTMCGDYDKDAPYEELLAEAEFEMEEKYGRTNDE